LTNKKTVLFKNQSVIDSGVERVNSLDCNSLALAKPEKPDTIGKKQP
jgi:hypothetical protein